MDFFLQMSGTELNEVTCNHGSRAVIVFVIIFLPHTKIISNFRLCLQNPAGAQDGY